MNIVKIILFGHNNFYEYVYQLIHMNSSMYNYLPFRNKIIYSSAYANQTQYF